MKIFSSSFIHQTLICLGGTPGCYQNTFLISQFRNLKNSLEKNKNYIGKNIKVLVNGISEETDLLLESRSEFQGPEVDGIVYINEGKALPGRFYNVEITEAYQYDLIGKII